MSINFVSADLRYLWRSIDRLRSCSVLDSDHAECPRLASHDFKLNVFHFWQMNFASHGELAGSTVWGLYLLLLLLLLSLTKLVNNAIVLFDCSLDYPVLKKLWSDLV